MRSVTYLNATIIFSVMSVFDYVMKTFLLNLSPSLYSKNLFLAVTQYLCCEIAKPHTVFIVKHCYKSLMHSLIQFV